jgi:hypothetical protein
MSDPASDSAGASVGVSYYHETLSSLSPIRSNSSSFSTNLYSSANNSNADNNNHVSTANTNILSVNTSIRYTPNKSSSARAAAAHLALQVSPRLLISNSTLAPETIQLSDNPFGSYLNNLPYTSNVSGVSEMNINSSLSSIPYTSTNSSSSLGNNAIIGRKLSNITRLIAESNLNPAEAHSEIPISINQSSFNSFSSSTRVITKTQISKTQLPKYKPRENAPIKHDYGEKSKYFSAGANQTAIIDSVEQSLSQPSSIYFPEESVIADEIANGNYQIPKPEIQNADTAPRKKAAVPAHVFRNKVKKFSQSVAAAKKNKPASRAFSSKSKLASSTGNAVAVLTALGLNLETLEDLTADQLKQLLKEIQLADKKPSLLTSPQPNKSANASIAASPIPTNRINSHMLDSGLLYDLASESLQFNTATSEKQSNNPEMTSTGAPGHKNPSKPLLNNFINDSRASASAISQVLPADLLSALATRNRTLNSPMPINSLVLEQQRIIGNQQRHLAIEEAEHQKLALARHRVERERVIRQKEEAKLRKKQALDYANMIQAKNRAEKEEIERAEQLRINEALAAANSLPADGEFKVETVQSDPQLIIQGHNIATIPVHHSSQQEASKSARTLSARKPGLPAAARAVSNKAKSRSGSAATAAIRRAASTKAKDDSGVEKTAEELRARRRELEQRRRELLRAAQLRELDKRNQAELLAQRERSEKERIRAERAKQSLQLQQYIKQKEAKRRGEEEAENQARIAAEQLKQAQLAEIARVARLNAPQNLEAAQAQLASPQFSQSVAKSKAERKAWINNFALEDANQEISEIPRETEAGVREQAPSGSSRKGKKKAAEQTAPRSVEEKQISSELIELQAKLERMIEQCEKLYHKPQRPAPKFFSASLSSQSGGEEIKLQAVRSSVEQFTERLNELSRQENPPPRNSQKKKKPPVAELVDDPASVRHATLDRHEEAALLRSLKSNSAKKPVSVTQSSTQSASKPRADPRVQKLMSAWGLDRSPSGNNLPQPYTLKQFQGDQRAKNQALEQKWQTIRSEMLEKDDSEAAEEERRAELQSALNAIDTVFQHELKSNTPTKASQRSKPLDADDTRAYVRSSRSVASDVDLANSLNAWDKYEDGEAEQESLDDSSGVAYETDPNEVAEDELASQQPEQQRFNSADLVQDVEEPKPINEDSLYDFDETQPALPLMKATSAAAEAKSSSKAAASTYIRSTPPSSRYKSSPARNYRANPLMTSQELALSPPKQYVTASSSPQRPSPAAAKSKKSASLELTEAILGELDYLQQLTNQHKKLAAYKQRKEEEKDFFQSSSSPRSPDLTVASTKLTPQSTPNIQNSGTKQRFELERAADEEAFQTELQRIRADTQARTAALEKSLLAPNHSSTKTPPRRKKQQSFNEANFQIQVEPPAEQQLEPSPQEEEFEALLHQSAQPLSPSPLASTLNQFPSPKLFSPGESSLEAIIISPTLQDATEEEEFETVEASASPPAADVEEEEVNSLLVPEPDVRTRADSVNDFPVQEEQFNQTQPIENETVREQYKDEEVDLHEEVAEELAGEADQYPADTEPAATGTVADSFSEQFGEVEGGFEQHSNFNSTGQFETQISEHNSPVSEDYNGSVELARAEAESELMAAAGDDEVEKDRIRKELRRFATEEARLRWLNKEKEKLRELQEQEQGARELAMLEEEQDRLIAEEEHRIKRNQLEEQSEQQLSPKTRRLQSIEKKEKIVDEVTKAVLTDLFQQLKSEGKSSNSSIAPTVPPRPRKLQTLHR